MKHWRSADARRYRAKGGSGFRWQMIFRATARISCCGTTASPNPIVVPIRSSRRPGLPQRQRAAHAEALAQAVGQALDAARQQMAARDAGVAVGTPGFYLEVQLPGTERAGLDLLADRRQHMEVVAVREPAHPGDPLLASVFVPSPGGKLLSAQDRSLSHHGHAVRPTTERAACLEDRHRPLGDGAVAIHRRGSAVSAAG